MRTFKITAAFFAAALAVSGLASTAAHADSESYPASSRGITYRAVQLPVTADTNQNVPPPAVHTLSYPAVQHPVTDDTGSERPRN